MKVNIHVDLAPKAVRVLVDGVDQETAVDVGVAVPEEVYHSEPAAEMPVPMTETVEETPTAPVEEEKSAEEK